MLDQLDLQNASQDPAQWEKVVQKLRAGAMPPAGTPRPDQAALESFIQLLEGELDRAAAAIPDPGRATIHRLNRSEYTNAIHDLLSVEVDGRSLLPADDSGYGFDNNADVLTVSPALLSRYMSAARKISRLVVGGSTADVESQTYRIPKYFRQDDRRSEDFSFASRGGIAIPYIFPANGKYLAQVQLEISPGGDVKGLNEPHQLEFRLDGARIGMMTVGARLAPRSADGTNRRLVTDRLGDSPLSLRFQAPAGTHLLTVAFLKETWEPEEVLRPRAVGYAFDHDMAMPPAVAEVKIEGPFDSTGVGQTASRQAVFQCYPASPAEEEPCASRILSTLARRAYRRSVSSVDVDDLMEFYRAGRQAGSFDAGIERALERLLIDPQFLFRIERDPANSVPNRVYRISDVELASRLSFFLWSSIPDQELIDLAIHGRLQDTAVLEQQVRRMLADPKSQALVDNFGGEWLQLRNLQLVAPDHYLFPDFDENLRESFQRETELFLESQLREDRGIGELLTANYTFLNERLARHYGIPNIYGNRFRRVALSEDSPRRGLIGKGSMLMVTSYATRTSPVLRGKWLLDNVLGTPPPPPPANVPSLPEHGENGQPRSVRERLEAHRANPMCASCHKQMDPLGFALENFDAVGKWRTSDGGTPIDASSTLPDGTALNGPADLQRILSSRKDAFSATVTEKLLTYALGRGLDYYDVPAIRKIVRDAEPSNARWSAVILGIVRSTPFQMRRAGS